ncbi:unnamed protein product [Microthlaspi erraticum]|uniref:Uncharacterized protein n=1 Tax=Microthlaspi erraticum TaxID=1685480 RepID=A0A6D2L3C4_9BRAS|nr:unnamed protein product [Microthlaspi erraticum]
MSSPQAPPPSWDSPPRLSPLKSKKNLLPYLEAADLETSSQAAYREEHLLATPEEEIDPELIEFVKRDQFHDLFRKCAKEHLYNFEQLCNYYGLGDNPKKIQLVPTITSWTSQEWVKFNAQHAFKTWNRYKEAFLYRFAKVHLCSTTRPSYSQHHPSSPDINKHPFAEESSKPRPTKIEVMLQNT